MSGYPKVQATFARVIGYVEQSDIHSAHVSGSLHCGMIPPSISYVLCMTCIQDQYLSQHVALTPDAHGL